MHTSLCILVALLIPDNGRFTIWTTGNREHYEKAR